MGRQISKQFVYKNVTICKILIDKWMYNIKKKLSYINNTNSIYEVYQSIFDENYPDRIYFRYKWITVNNAFETVIIIKKSAFT